MLPLDSFTYPPVTTTDTSKSYNYLPVSSGTYLADYIQAREIIDSIDNGKFTIAIPIVFDTIFGNFNETGRYPTQE